MTGPEGIEQVLPEFLGNGARIHDGQSDAVRLRAIEPDSDPALRVAVLQRIADQIGYDLCDALGVPESEKLARGG